MASVISELTILDELAILQDRIDKIKSSAAEEAAIRARDEKRASAMSRLKNILKDKISKLESNRYSKSAPLAAYYDREKVDLIDTLIDIIDGLNERIANLEMEKSSH
jgi:hypothetical protein